MTSSSTANVTHTAPTKRHTPDHSTDNQQQLSSSSDVITTTAAETVSHIDSYHQRAETELYAVYRCVCLDLNMDRATTREAWCSYRLARCRYTLDGPPRHWMACALYVACRDCCEPSVLSAADTAAPSGAGDTTAPPSGGGDTRSRTAMRGNFVSLTRLLHACQLSLLEFFDKCRKWSVMCHMPAHCSHHLETLKRNLAVTMFLFNNYFCPIFARVFVARGSGTDGPQSAGATTSLMMRARVKNKRHRNTVPCTSDELFAFAWTLFVLIKSMCGNSSFACDLVSTYHLLLACVDYVYCACLQDRRFDLLNRELAGAESGGCVTTGPEFPASVLQILCSEFDGLLVEVKSVKQHYLRQKLASLHANGVLLHSGGDSLLSTPSSTSTSCVTAAATTPESIVHHYYFSENMSALGRRYEEFLLTRGQFDERTLLYNEKDWQTVIGTPHEANNFSVTCGDLAHRTLLRRALQHKNQSNSTPLTAPAPLLSAGTAASEEQDVEDEKNRRTQVSPRAGACDTSILSSCVLSVSCLHAMQAEEQQNSGGGDTRGGRVTRLLENSGIMCTRVADIDRLSVDSISAVRERFLRAYDAAEIVTNCQHTETGDDCVPSQQSPLKCRDNSQATAGDTHRDNAAAAADTTLAASTVASTRFETSLALYYRQLANIIQAEITRRPHADLNVLLLQPVFHRCLLACCLEIVLHSYGGTRTQFPWLLDQALLGLVEPYDFYKLLEVIIREERALCRDVIKHLSQVEEHVLETMAWRPESRVWAVVRRSARAPSVCETSGQAGTQSVATRLSSASLLLHSARLHRLCVERRQLLGQQHSLHHSPLGVSSVASERFMSPLASNSNTGSPQLALSGTRRCLFVTDNVAVTAAPPGGTVTELSAAGCSRKRSRAHMTEAPADKQSSVEAAKHARLGDTPVEAVICKSESLSDVEIDDETMSLDSVATTCSSVSSTPSSSVARAARSVVPLCSSGSLTPTLRKVSQHATPTATACTDEPCHSFTPTSATSTTTASSSAASSSAGLFFRKFYHLAWVRLRDLCERLDLLPTAAGTPHSTQSGDSHVCHTMWTLFEHVIVTHTHLMCGRHLDQLLMSTVFVVCKAHALGKKFTDIMAAYRHQPQAKSHVYRSVLLCEGATSVAMTTPGSTYSTPGSAQLVDNLRVSSSRYTLNGVEQHRGDIIHFYNHVFVDKVKHFLSTHFTRASTFHHQLLSPLVCSSAPPVCASYASSPSHLPAYRRRVSHSVYVSPLKHSTHAQFPHSAHSTPGGVGGASGTAGPTHHTPRDDTHTRSYQFNVSPAQTLRSINSMLLSPRANGYTPTCKTGAGTSTLLGARNSLSDSVHRRGATVTPSGGSLQHPPGRLLEGAGSQQNGQPAARASCVKFKARLKDTIIQRKLISDV